MAASARIGFLGLKEDWSQVPDVSVIQLPLEMTVSYGTGTSMGPSATLEASSQIETYSDYLADDLPAGMNIRTLDAWEFEGPTLISHLESIQSHIEQGITHVTLAVHYLADQMQSFVREWSDKRLVIDCVYEDEPLGTGGAIANAINKTGADDKIICQNAISSMSMFPSKVIIILYCYKCTRK